ncbi:unknown [Clostridium sp. CAG:277]|nr:unknown [Clostridium sp. CAG:277]
MKKNKKLQSIKKNKKDQVFQYYLEIPERDSEDIAGQQEYLKSDKMQENLEHVEKYFQEIDYTQLVEKLQKVEVNKKYVKELNTKIIPYEIPEMYSLNVTIKKLAVIETKMNKLSQYIKKTDIEAVSTDWRKIGRCINEAIFKSTGNYTR